MLLLCIIDQIIHSRLIRWATRNSTAMLCWIVINNIAQPDTIQLPAEVSGCVCAMVCPAGS